MVSMNRDTTYHHVENVIERGWQFYADRPWAAGIFYRTGFDYRGEPNPLSYPATGSEFGILDYCGFWKDEAWYLKSWWTDEPTPQASRVRIGWLMCLAVYSQTTPKVVETSTNGYFPLCADGETASICTDAKDYAVVGICATMPAEKEISFVMELAWDIHRWQPTEAHNYIWYWAAKTFGTTAVSSSAFIFWIPVSYCKTSPSFNEFFAD